MENSVIIQPVPNIPQQGTDPGRRIGHDLNNVFTVIGTCVTEAAKHAFDLRGQRFLDKAQHSIATGIVLAQDLLRNKTSREASKASKDLGCLVRDTVELACANSDVVPTFRLGPDLWPVYMDVAGVVRIVLNLAVNAVEAMPQGGILAVTCWNETEPTGSFVKIRLHDTGPGIPDSILPHIFNPDFTTKPNGNGLGLAIVCNMVEQAGGTVRVRCRKDQGTEFLVSLPTVADSLSQA